VYTDYHNARSSKRTIVRKIEGDYAVCLVRWLYSFTLRVRRSHCVGVGARSIHASRWRDCGPATWYALFLLVLLFSVLLRVSTYFI
jgi:hypothetical protein